jgi:hypothetical protein
MIGEIIFHVVMLTSTGLVKLFSTHFATTLKVKVGYACCGLQRILHFIHFDTGVKVKVG